MDHPIQETIIISIHVNAPGNGKEWKKADGNTAKMAMLETFEVFSLSYDVHDAKFHLNLCYADGKTLSMAYQKLEYCDWKDDDTEESVKWDLHEVTQEIINDIESAVPTKLQEP